MDTPANAPKTVEEIEAELQAISDQLRRFDNSGIQTPEDANEVAFMLVQARDLEKRANSIRKKERKPHFIAQKEIDNAFFHLTNEKVGGLAVAINGCKTLLKPWLVNRNQAKPRYSRAISLMETLVPVIDDEKKVCQHYWNKSRPALMEKIMELIKEDFRSPGKRNIPGVSTETKHTIR